MKNPLAIGQRITVFRVDDVVGLTHRYEFTVNDAFDPMKEASCCDGVKFLAGVVCQRGKQKSHKLYIGQDDIVLNGWDMPFKVDSETGAVFYGDGAYHFIGDIAKVRECIENLYVFPVSDATKNRVLVSLVPITAELLRTPGVNAGLLYPQEAFA